MMSLLACAPAPEQGWLTDWTLQQQGSSQQYQVNVPCSVAGAPATDGKHHLQVGMAGFKRDNLLQTGFPADFEGLEIGVHLAKGIVDMREVRGIRNPVSPGGDIAHNDIAVVGDVGFVGGFMTIPSAGFSQESITETKQKRVVRICFMFTK